MPLNQNPALLETVPGVRRLIPHFLKQFKMSKAGEIVLPSLATPNPASYTLIETKITHSFPTF